MKSLFKLLKGIIVDRQNPIYMF